VVISEQHIRQLETPRGGMKSAVILALMGWELHRGAMPPWKRLILHTEIPDERWRKALALARGEDQSALFSI
jgi:hypothetical protein